MKRNYKIYLNDIIQFMERAEKYLLELSLDEFLKDIKTCDAVIRCLEVIGEATKKVPDEVRNRHPEIPWKEMAGM